jgi:hypothetical protein
MHVIVPGLLGPRPYSPLWHLNLQHHRSKKSDYGSVPSDANQSQSTFAASPRQRVITAHRWGSPPCLRIRHRSTRSPAFEGRVQDRLQSFITESPVAYTPSADSRRPLDLSWVIGWEQRGGDGGRWPAARLRSGWDSVNERETNGHTVFGPCWNDVLLFLSNTVGAFCGVERCWR